MLAYVNQGAAMPLKVTFDSNAWRVVADPKKHQKDPLLPIYEKIRSAVCANAIAPFLSETVFTLEGIWRKNRRFFFGNYEAEMSFKQIAKPDGSEQLTFILGPNLSAHPGNDKVHQEYLDEALKIGFKIMMDLRIAMITNPDLRPEYFADYPGSDISAYVEKLSEVDRKMHMNRCGIWHIQSIGEAFAKPGENWLDGLDNADASLDGPISKAIAEWADGDTIAAHIAFKNDFVLTNDQAKSGGADSVFARKNLKWLRNDYGLELISQAELAAKL